jgi:septum formation protein
MGQCITKPQSRTHAAELLASFSAGTQQVLTAVAFQRPGLDLRCEVVESTVTFKRLTDRMISAYLDSVDPMDKAGAYDIGQHGDMIIASHTGSYTNIVGLPMELVTRWLREAGIL